MSTSSGEVRPLSPRSASSTSSESYRPGYERAAERIVELIATRQLQPGDRLPTEADLAADLGFGRSVVREAVKVLSALGRVQARKGAGLYVADTMGILPGRVTSGFVPADLGHLSMLFEFRIIVDSEASRLAATRATPQQVRALERAVRDSCRAVELDDRVLFDSADEAFHLGIAEAAANMFIVEAQRTVRQLQMQAVVLGLGGGQGGSFRAAADAHRTILDHIQAGDAEAAALAARHHVEQTWGGYQDEIRRRILGAPDRSDRPDRPDRSGR